MVDISFITSLFSCHDRNVLKKGNGITAPLHTFFFGHVVVVLCGRQQRPYLAYEMGLVTFASPSPFPCRRKPHATTMDTVRPMLLHPLPRHLSSSHTHPLINNFNFNFRIRHLHSRSSPLKLTTIPRFKRIIPNCSVTNGAVSANANADAGFFPGKEELLKYLPGGGWWEVEDAKQHKEQQQNAKTRTSTWNALRQLWQLISPNRALLFVAFSSLLVAAASEISIPSLIAATVFSAQRASQVEFYHNARLLTLMGCLFGLFSGIRGACFGIVNQILVQRMREKLFSSIIKQDIEFFDKYTTGILTSRLGSDCQQVSRVIGNDLNILLRSCLQGAGALIYLVILSWKLALFTASLCTIIAGILFVYGNYQRRMAKCAQDAVASANDVAEESISLVRLVRIFGTEEQESERYSKWLQTLVRINLRQNVAYGFWAMSSNSIYYATQVVALFVGGRFVMNGNITAEELTKFILYAEWVIQAAWWAGDQWASLMQSVGASEKVFELMNRPPCKELTSQGIKLQNLKGCIEFKNVSFSYPTRPEIPVLQNCNLSVYPGELIALVGLSGSGKSTLVNLLLGLYEPTGGNILVDGTCLTELDTKWFHSHIGVVSQEPDLFNMDISSNISYGCGRNVRQEDIEVAAKHADAHDFISSLPNRYRTPVDNARLSGGQKQRIAIARALLRNPTILIFDEATSALDSESENFINEALQKLRQRNLNPKCTSIVIAHRLSTIREADRIVVMQGGRISEMGTHEELLQENGEYAKLTRKQLESIL